MKKGIFCISFDTELLWGRHDLGYESFIKRAKSERAIIHRLLALLEKYTIPATWAIVGHLFLERCASTNGIKHPEIVRPSYPWVKNDWFESDPAGNIVQNPEWYGKDIVKDIMKTGLHEIGSHSFSHVVLGHKGCDRKCAESEIATCKKLAINMGIKLVSFVFPRNSIGHLEILRKNGFIAFRGQDAVRFKLPGLLKPLGLVLELFIPLPPPTSKPINQKGLINIQGSMYFVSARGIRKYIPGTIRSGKAIKGIDSAINKREVFHLWTHPGDFTDQRPVLFDELESILKYASQKRSAGYLEIKTMGETARQVLS